MKALSRVLLLLAFIRYNHAEEEKKAHPCPFEVIIVPERKSNTGRQAVSGNPELAPGSKELAPEERGAVKILHAGLLLQGPPPASTRKGRRLLERNVVAPDRKSASETRRH